MRKITYPFILLFTACITSIAFAGSGSAVVPMFYVITNANGSQAHPWLYMTNITDDDITVTVTYYDRLGTILSDGEDSQTAGLIRGVNLNNYDGSLAGASATFTISPNNQGIIYLQPAVGDPSRTGSALIEWSQDSNARVGLIAHQLTFTSDPNGPARYSVCVNGGLPF